MNPEEIRRGVVSLINDGPAFEAFIGDCTRLQKILEPRRTERKPPALIGETAKPGETAGHLIRSSDRRGGWRYALWHDARLSSALADEVRHGFIEDFPVTRADIEAGREATVARLFGTGEVRAPQPMGRMPG